MNIAIIGAGVAGSTILKTLLDSNKLTRNDRIYIFESRHVLGPGSPYDEDSVHKMLNVSAKVVSMDENDPLDFYKWLKENQIPVTNDEDLTSRVHYGLYLRDFFESYYNHELVTIINDEVTDIDLANGSDKLRIKTSVWFDQDFDQVIMTIGHPAYADYYDLEESENFIQDPYPLKEKLARISNSSRVGIMGAGSTSMDAFRYLTREKSLENPIYFFIRKNIFQLPNFGLDREIEFTYSIDKDWIEDNTVDGHISLYKIIKTVDEDLKKNSVDIMSEYDKVMPNTLEKYQDYLDKEPIELGILSKYLGRLEPLLPDLFGLMTKEDQNEYMEKYHDIFETFYTLTPPKTTQWIIDEVKKGKVKFVKGLEDVELEGEHFKVIADEEVEVDYLINTTGFQMDLEENAKTNTLISNLLDRQIIQAHKDGKIVDIAYPGNQVISPKYGQMDNLYLIGMFTNGIHYMPNGVNSISSVARDLGQEIVEKL